MVELSALRAAQVVEEEEKEEQEEREEKLKAWSWFVKSWLTNHNLLIEG